MLLMGSAYGEITSSFSASDGERVVGFSTTYGADVEDSISDQASASFAEGPILSRSLLAAGDLHEEHYVNDAANGLHARVRVDVVGATDSIYNYVMSPAEGEVGPSAYVQGRQTLTSTDADSIYVEVLAHNPESSAYGSITVEDGTLQGYSGTARAAPDYATAIQMAEHAEGAHLLYTSESNNEMADLAYHTLDVTNGQVDGYNGAGTAYSDSVSSIINSADVSTTSNTVLEIKAKNSQYDIGRIKTDISSGQMSVTGAKVWADETPRAGASMGNLHASANIVTNTLQTGVEAPPEHFSNLGIVVSGDLDFGGIAQKIAAGTTLTTHLTALGSIQETLYAKNRGGDVEAKASTRIYHGGLDFSGTANTGASTASVDVELQAASPAETLTHQMVAGSLLNPYYTVEDADLRAVEYVEVQAGTLGYTGNAKAWKGSSNAMIAVDLLGAHTDMGSIVHSIGALSPRDDCVCPYFEIYGEGGAADHIFSGWTKANDDLAQVTFSHNTIASSGSITKLTEARTPTIAGCATQLYASDYAEIHFGHICSIEGARSIFGGDPAKAQASVNVEELEASTLDMGMGSEISHSSGAENEVDLATNSQITLSTFGCATTCLEMVVPSSATLSYSGSSLAANNKVTHSESTEGKITEPGCISYGSSLFAGPINLFQDIQLWPSGTLYPFLSHTGTSTGLLGPSGYSGGIGYDLHGYGGFNSLFGASYYPLYMSFEDYDGIDVISGLHTEEGSVDLSGSVKGTEGSGNPLVGISEEGLDVEGYGISHTMDATNGENHIAESVQVEGYEEAPGHLSIESAQAFANPTIAKVQLNDLLAQGSFIGMSLGSGVDWLPCLEVEEQPELLPYAGVSGSISGQQFGDLAFSGYALDSGSESSRTVRETTSSLSAGGDSIYLEHRSLGLSGTEELDTHSLVSTTIENGYVDPLYGYAVATPLTTLAYQRGTAFGDVMLDAYGEAYNPYLPDQDTSYGGMKAFGKTMFYYNKAWTDPSTVMETHGKVYV
ncbi:MAG: hypothetical protein JW986_06460 [Methanotrichaceae archaeon]|nr:hypothetical protein [Methanotrichaceae archaeon]